MKTRQGTISILLIALFFGFSGCKKSNNEIVYDKKYLDEIKLTRKDLRFYLSSNNVPGASITISKKGKIIYSEAMGLASKDLKVPVTHKTKFRIGELSELFTSFIYQRMVEEGTLQPDSSVQYYLPDFPKKMYKITPWLLVNNASGIREATRLEEDWRGLNITLQKGLEEFKDDPLESEPKMIQTKSMFNYNLLGAIMEKTTNKRFNRILKEYVTDTLKLSNTTVDNPFITIEGRTNYFDQNMIAQVVNATLRDMRFRAPSRGILSNTDDLVKFADAIFNTDILSKKTQKSLLEPIILFKNIPSEMANGWKLMKDVYGNNMYGRGGSVTGGSAAILVHPKYELIIAITINLTLNIDDSPIFKIAEHFADKAEEKTEDTTK